MNLAGVDQRVDVQSANAFTHQLSITGGEQSITVGVKSGLTLSATTELTVGNNAVVELDNGNLAGGTIEVHGGGQLSGNGFVLGNLVLGSNDPETATLSPGFSVGQLTVQGNYQQLENGTMSIELVGTTSGQFDKVNISGQMELGGTLVFDASALGPGAAGETVEILTAASLNGRFDSVQTTGSDLYYIRPIYDDGAGAGAGSGGPGGSGSLTGSSSVAGGICDLGDMNCDGSLNGGDTTAFATALRDLDAYFETYFTFTSSGGDLDGIGTPEFQPNGRVDFDDIDDFVKLVSAGSGASPAFIMAELQRQLTVPEPSSIAFVLISVMIAAACFRHRQYFGASGFGRYTGLRRLGFGAWCGRFNDRNPDCRQPSRHVRSSRNRR